MMLKKELLDQAEACGIDGPCESQITNINRLQVIMDCIPWIGVT